VRDDRAGFFLFVIPANAGSMDDKLVIWVGP
jgi:hypothetical protein